MTVSAVFIRIIWRVILKIIASLRRINMAKRLLRAASLSLSSYSFRSSSRIQPAPAGDALRAFDLPGDGEFKMQHTFASIAWYFYHSGVWQTGRFTDDVNLLAFAKVVVQIPESGLFVLVRSSPRDITFHAPRQNNACLPPLASLGIFFPPPFGRILPVPQPCACVNVLALPARILSQSLPAYGPLLPIRRGFVPPARWFPLRRRRCQWLWLNDDPLL